MERDSEQELADVFLAEINALWNMYLDGAQRYYLDATLMGRDLAGEQGDTTKRIAQFARNASERLAGYLLDRPVLRRKLTREAVTRLQILGDMAFD